MPRKKKITTKETETQTIKEEEKEEDDEEAVKQCAGLKFECPVCKKFLEMQNELVIRKKGDCSCKCSPFSFKISKKDKNLSIEKKENGDISLETDIHDITFKWGKQITPTEDTSTQDTLKSIMDKRT